MVCGKDDLPPLPFCEHCDREEGWWIAIVDHAANFVLSYRKLDKRAVLAAQREPRGHVAELKFNVPSAGAYALSVMVLSDYWIGADARYPVKIKVGRRTPELLEKRAAAAAGKPAAGKKKLARTAESRRRRREGRRRGGRGGGRRSRAGGGVERRRLGIGLGRRGARARPRLPLRGDGHGGVLRRGDGGGVPEAGAAAPRGAGGAAQVRRGEDFGGEQGGRRRVARGEVRGRGRARRFGQLMRDTERGIGDERRVFDLDTSRVIVSIVLDVHSSTATPLKSPPAGRPSLIRDVVLALVDVFLHNLGVLAVDGAAGGFRGAEFP